MRISLTPNAESLRRMRQIGPNLLVDFSMSDPALLTALGAVHRRQEAEIFASEGSSGGGGSWPALEDRYAKRKQKAVGNRKILDLSGDMKNRFTMATDPGYFQEFVPTSETRGTFRFGARSDVAAAHLYGDPLRAPSQSDLARSVFGGRAPRLPVRDMITKTAAHLEEFKVAILAWFRGRVAQRVKGAAALETP